VSQFKFLQLLED